MSKRKLEYKTLPFQMTSNTVASEGCAQGRIMEGYASTWSMDLGGDIIEPGAFTKCIQQRFTDEVAARGYGRIRFMSEHKTVIGRIIDIRQDEHGLWVKAFFSETRLGNDICTLVNDHALDQMSIGFVVPAGGSYKDKQGNRHITEIDCQEASIVTFPMNEETEVLDVKGADTPFSQIEAASELAASEEPILSDEVALNTEEANTLLEHEIKSMSYHLANAALEIKKGKKLSAETTGKLMKVLATVHEVLSSSMIPKNVNDEEEELVAEETPDVAKGITGSDSLRTVFSEGVMDSNQKPVADKLKKSSNSSQPNVDGVNRPIAAENPANPQTAPEASPKASDVNTPAAQDDSDGDESMEMMESNQCEMDELASLLDSAASMLATMR